MQTPLPVTRQGENTMLWITDPLSTLDQSKDTTLRLMQEAINMGIPTFWSASDQVLHASTSGWIQAIELKNSLAALASEKLKLESFPLSMFQQIHFRIDPPVDENYCKLVDELLVSGASKRQILNPPDLIKNQSEKIPPADLGKHTPRMKVIQSRNDLSELQKQFDHDSEIVSKPLHLAQSIGVALHQTPKSAADWLTLIEGLTHNFTQEILIEEYLPAIHQGEVRLWFAGEKFIAALKKYPKTGDFRVLIDEGSRVTAHTLTLEEELIAADIGQSLKRQGILLAAVDLIGNKICDYNITSPGLLIQLETVHGNQNFAKEILVQALQYHAQQDL